MAYTTEVDIENYLLTTIDSSFSSQITSWIAMAKKWIDNYTGRTFEKATATRKFDGSGSDTLYVDDLLSVTSLKIYDLSGNLLADLSASDYLLYSNFYKADDPNSTPYNKIVLNPVGSYWAFDWGLQNVSITGDWGFSATVPDDIKMVATKLVAGIIKVGKDGQVRSFSEGDYSVTYESFASIANRDLSVQNILNFYKRPQSLTGYGVTRV